MNMRRTAGLACMSMLLLSAPALAQRPSGVVRREDQTQRPGIEAESEKLALYFSGHPWRKGSVQPGRVEPPAIEGLPSSDAVDEPTWFTNWRTGLGKALQPTALGSALHPMLRATPVVLALDLAPHAQPVLAAEVPWTRLVCPAQEGAPRWAKLPVLDVSLHVLQVSDDGHHLLGLDLACIGQQPSQLLRAARLLVATDSQGNVLRVHGVLLDAPLALLPRPSGVEASVQWPLQFVPFDRSRPAHWPASPGGWIVQAQVSLPVTWHAPNGLPGLDGSAPLTPEEDVVPEKRVALHLDAEGTPKAAFFQDRVVDSTGSKPRAPVDREGLSEWLLPGKPGVLLLQRVGLRAAQGQGVGMSHLAYTDAGYAAWHLLPDGALTPLPVALPRLPGEGLWHCQPDGTEDRLRCHFEHAGAPGTQTPEDVLLGQVAGKGIVPVRE